MSHKWDLALYACGTRTWDAEARRSWVQGYLEMHSVVQIVFPSVHTTLYFYLLLSVFFTNPLQHIWNKTSLTPSAVPLWLWRLSSCFISCLGIFFGEIPIQIHAHFFLKKKILLLVCEDSLYILDTIYIRHANIFFWLVSFFLTAYALFFKISFWWSPHSFMDHLRNLCLIQGDRNFLLRFL